MEKLKFLGIGGALNIDLGGNSAFLKKKDKLLVIDACEGATEKLLKNNIFDGIKEAYIVITHTHYDHVAGLGTLIWYLNYKLKVKTYVIYNSKRYLNHLKRLFKTTGVDLKLINFIKDIDFSLGDLTLKLKLTAHEPTLICNGIMFSDKEGKYYYTGDTNDIEYIRKIAKDDSVKTIYSEVSESTYDVHIAYGDLQEVISDKFIFMHINSMKLYEQIKKDGHNIANLI